MQRMKYNMYFPHLLIMSPDRCILNTLVYEVNIEGHLTCLS
jgi:hypothetical protein